MPKQDRASSRVARLAHELSQCRERGLDYLDLHTHNQQPVRTPALTRVARDYCVATGTLVEGRIAAIRVLLQAGLAVYAERGNQPESQFITSLFFDTSGTVPKQGPRQLMDAARNALGMAEGYDRWRFDAYRRTEFAKFAAFLLAFVAETARQP